jgi:hypothetical protein
MSDPLIAEMTLIELGVLRERNRRRAGSLRFTSYALGVLHVTTAGWVLVAGRDHVVMVYAPALLTIALLTGRRYKRVSRAQGVQAPLLPWFAAAWTALVVAAVVSRTGAGLGSPPLEEVGPTVVFAFAYHLLGWWGHNVGLVVATALMVPISLIAALFTSGDLLVAVQFAADGLLLILAAATPSRTEVR